MNHSYQKLIAASLAVVLLLSVQTQAIAGGIGFRNETPAPLIVQGSCVVNSMVRRGRPLLIYPRRVAWDNKLAPGHRIITIYDAQRPTHILFRKTIPFQGPDIFFAIRIINTPKGRTMMLVPQPRW
jgi:hypothetical protein